MEDGLLPKTWPVWIQITWAMLVGFVMNGFFMLAMFIGMYIATMITLLPFYAIRAIWRMIF